MNMKNTFVFVDIETTGLDPKSELILEVGMALYDKNLIMQESYCALITGGVNTGADLKLIKDAERTGDRYVLNMHKKSGLLEEWRDAAVGVKTTPERDVLDYSFCNPEDELVQVLESWGVAGKPMCGSSVHFDRAFLKEHMPALEAKFSYRNVDASSLMELLRVTNPDLLERALDVRVPDMAHRTLSDIEDSARLIEALIKAIKSDEVKIGA